MAPRPFLGPAYRENLARIKALVAERLGRLGGDGR